MTQGQVKYYAEYDIFENPSRICTAQPRAIKQQ